MKTKKIIGGAALALLLTTGAVSASAYQGDYTVEGPNCTPERHEAMLEAFDTTDYSAWYELMGDKGRVAQVVNEDNFALFAEAHNLAQAGDYEEADLIRQELGLRGRDGEKMGAGFRGGKGGNAGSQMGTGTGRGAK